VIPFWLIREVGPQSLAGPVQPHLNRSFGCVQQIGDALLLQILPVAEVEKHAILRRQARDRSPDVDPGGYFFGSHLTRGFPRPGRRLGIRLVATPPHQAKRLVPRYLEQPWLRRAGRPARVALSPCPCERLLRGVLGVVRIAKQAAGFSLTAGVQ
jgi:hypothetical protein